MFGLRRTVAAKSRTRTLGSRLSFYLLNIQTCSRTILTPPRLLRLRGHITVDARERTLTPPIMPRAGKKGKNKNNSSGPNSLGALARHLHTLDSELAGHYFDAQQDVHRLVSSELMFRT